MTWPQYWAWLLCGVAASEITSLGSHTDLWLPHGGRPSPMARARGWAERLAPLRPARDILGPVTQSWRTRCGLPTDCMVLCGLHDSNAALLAARRYPETAGACTVLSTGTWFVAMRALARDATFDFDALCEARDCLVNIDTFGLPVPSSRFMGGARQKSWKAACVTITPGRRRWACRKPGAPSIHRSSSCRVSRTRWVPCRIARAPGRAGRAMHWSAAPPSALGGPQHSVQLIYLVIGVGVLLFAWTMARAWLPEIHDAGHGMGIAALAGKPLLQQRHFTLGVLTLALYIGSQVGIAGFFINLATETWPGLTSQGGAFLLSVAMLAYLAGRFLTTALMLRVSARTVLIVYGLVNVGLCLVVAAGMERISAMALAATFFFMGPMFPTVFALGIRDLGIATKRASSIMVMAIGGGAILPYPMGFVGDHWGMPPAFLLPAAGFAVVALYGWTSARD